MQSAPMSGLCRAAFRPQTMAPISMHSNQAKPVAYTLHSVSHSRISRSEPETFRLYRKNASASPATSASPMPMPSMFLGLKPSCRTSAALLTAIAAAKATTGSAVSIMNRQLAPVIAV